MCSLIWWEDVLWWAEWNRVMARIQLWRFDGDGSNNQAICLWFSPHRHAPLFTQEKKKKS